MSMGYRRNQTHASSMETSLTEEAFPSRWFSLSWHSRFCIRTTSSSIGVIMRYSSRHHSFLKRQQKKRSLWYLFQAQTMNKVYGFEGEVRAKYTPTAYDLFSELFCCLPLAHVINDKVLVVHGGTFYIPLEMNRLIHQQYLESIQACFQRMELFWTIWKRSTGFESLQTVAWCANFCGPIPKSR